MKCVFILFIVLLFSQGVFSQTAYWQLLEKLGRTVTTKEEKKKIDEIYNALRREEVRLSQDTFFNGRDTLYLIVDPSDPLQDVQTDEIIWWVHEMTKKDSLIALRNTEIYVFLRKKLSYVKDPKMRRLIDSIELSSLKLTTRQQLSDFYRREYTRDSVADGILATHIVWYYWDFKEYFYRVYVIVPKENGQYLMMCYF